MRLPSLPEPMVNHLTLASSSRLSSKLCLSSSSNSTSSTTTVIDSTTHVHQRYGLLLPSFCNASSVRRLLDQVSNQEGNSSKQHLPSRERSAMIESASASPVCRFFFFLHLCNQLTLSGSPLTAPPFGHPSPVRTLGFALNPAPQSILALAAAFPFGPLYEKLTKSRIESCSKEEKATEWSEARGRSKG